MGKSFHPPRRSSNGISVNMFLLCSLPTTFIERSRSTSQSAHLDVVFRFDDGTKLCDNLKILGSQRPASGYRRGTSTAQLDSLKSGSWIIRDCAGAWVNHRREVHH